MAKKRGGLSEFGSIAFIIGFVIAIVLGLIGAFVALGTLGTILLAIVVILGAIVGFLNITKKEAKDFLLVGVVLALIAYLGVQAGIFGFVLNSILASILAFVVPAVIIVSLRAVYRIERK